MSTERETLVPDISEHADSGWDDYAERVLRNEGRLEGLENLIAEIREADRKLIEQRSDSLAVEMERRADALLELVTAKADAVLALGTEEREADRRYVEVRLEEADRRGEMALGLLREVYDTAIQKNYEQSQEAINALEQRRIAATEKLEQMVRQWRDSDREAKELFAAELARHLDALNHNNERMREFQNQSVTRELWQSEKDAAITRESLLRDQIIALDRTMLTMTPIEQADKTHAEMLKRMETSMESVSKVLDNKIGNLTEKVEDLKSYTDNRRGRSAGYQSFYGWGIAAVTLVISVIIMANALTGNAVK